MVRLDDVLRLDRLDAGPLGSLRRWQLMFAVCRDLSAILGSVWV